MSAGVWKIDRPVLTMALCVTDETKITVAFGQTRPLFSFPLWLLLAHGKKRWHTTWEELLLANHNAKHLKIHTDTIPLPLKGKSFGERWVPTEFLINFWDFFLMNETQNYTMCTHSFPPHMHKILSLFITDSCEESSYWKLHTECKKWRRWIKDLHWKWSTVGVLHGRREGDPENEWTSARRHCSSGGWDWIIYHDFPFPMYLWYLINIAFLLIAGHSPGRGRKSQLDV